MTAIAPLPAGHHAMVSSHALSYVPVLLKRPTSFRFIVSFENRGLSSEETDLPRYPDDIIELDQGAKVGDLFSELYRRNSPEAGYEWSFASPVDRLIFRYPCKCDVPLSSAFSSPSYYNQNGEIHIIADQDHLLTEASTIINDYNFMISLIKRLPIPSEYDQYKRVTTCLSKVITGIMYRIKYRPDLPQFCHSNCIHQKEFNKLRIYANSVADGSIFGLNVPAAIPASEENEEHNTSHRRKRTRREAFPVESLPEELKEHIMTFLGPKELCSMEQVSTSWSSRANTESLWPKFCNGWNLRDEKENFLDAKSVVKIVHEIHACRRKDR